MALIDYVESEVTQEQFNIELLEYLEQNPNIQSLYEEAGSNYANLPCNIKKIIQEGLRIEVVEFYVRQSALPE